MDFHTKLLFHLHEVFLEGSFNDTRIYVQGGERRIPAFLLRALSPLFRQDSDWTSVILPDISLIDLDNFLDNLLVPFGEGSSPFPECILRLLQSFCRQNPPSVECCRKKSFSSKREVRSHKPLLDKRIIDTPRAETNYELRPFRKKVKFTDELSETEEESQEDESDSQNESDYEPNPLDDDDDEATDYTEKIKPSSYEVLLMKEEEDCSSQDEEEDEEETSEALILESEGEDDDLYEHHVSFHQPLVEDSEEDLTLFTVKLNEEGQIQTIHQLNDPGLVSNVGPDGVLSEETQRGPLSTHHRLLLKCFSCDQHFRNISALRYHSAKDHPGGSFFRLPSRHPHSNCLSCSALLSSYRSLILEEERELQLINVCFSCPHCRRRFMGRINALRTHLREEHFRTPVEVRKENVPSGLVTMRGSTQSLTCDFCGFSFETTRLLNHHFLSCTSAEVTAALVCRKCGKTFSQLQNLLLHCMNAHRGKTVINMSKAAFCSLCPAALISEAALKKHSDRHHRGSPHVTIHENCTPCTSLTKATHLLSQHVPKNLFKCPHCKMLFGSHHNDPLLYILNHVAQFHQEHAILLQEDNSAGVLDKTDKETFRCDFCSTLLESRLEFNDHISSCPLSNTSSVRPKYICELCGFSSGTSRSVRLHIGACHSELPPPLMMTASSGGKTSKGRRRSKSSKVKCPECEQDFKHVEDMQAHSLIHSGVMTCPVHDVLFKSEAQIYQHAIVGSALVCCMCPQSFRYMSGYLSHLRRHLKISPYKCSICQKSVQSYANLRYHVRRMHMEETSRKLFTCEYCCKGFTTKGHLKEHIAGVHERINNVHCPVCHKSFNTQKRMRKHLFSSHKDMADQFRIHSGLEVYEKVSKA